MLDQLIRAVPAVAWMTFIFVMSSQERFTQPFGLSTFLLSIAAHLFLYGVLATLLLLAFDRGGNTSKSARIAAIAGAVLFGISDEFHQSFVPGRDASLFDVAVNTLGAAIAVSIWAHVHSIFSADTTR